MKTNPVPYFICQIILLSILVTACSLKDSIKQTASPMNISIVSETPILAARATISVTPTSIHLAPTSLPTMTVTSTPSPTAIPSPSFPPLPTLSPQEAQKKIAILMETNDNCKKPCVWGIIPGTTRFEEAVQFFKTLFIGRIKSDGAKSSYDATFGIEKNGETVLLGDIIISASSDVVQSIRLDVDGIYKPSVTGRDWLAFRPDGFLKTYGMPKQVLIAFGEGSEGRLENFMYFLYDRMYIEYDTNQTIFLPQKILYSCPNSDRHMGMFRLWVGDYTKDEVSHGAVDITKMTSLTMDRFYQLMVGDPQKACFYLDYNKFLHPNN